MVSTVADATLPLIVLRRQKAPLFELCRNLGDGVI
jgi:hypothetical protein